jgi:hypothetical protein
MAHELPIKTTNLKIRRGQMKKRSLLGIMLSCTVLGVCCLTKAQTVNAEPASMFRPILRDIQTQLPRGWVMRLPSAVNLSDNPLYAKVVTSTSEHLTIFLNSRPDCQARFCQFGIITVAKDSEYANSLRSSPIFSKTEIARVRAIRQRDSKTWTQADYRELISSEKAVLERTPITLKQGIEGLFVVQNSGSFFNQPPLHVIWKQDGLNYQVSLIGGFDRQRNIVSQRDKSALINLASSMANESPIKSVR